MKTKQTNKYTKYETKEKKFSFAVMFAWMRWIDLKARHIGWICTILYGNSASVILFVWNSWWNANAFKWRCMIDMVDFYSRCSTLGWIFACIAQKKSKYKNMCLCVGTRIHVWTIKHVKWVRIDRWNSKVRKHTGDVG